MRTRREWARSSWTRPAGTERMRLAEIRGVVSSWIERADSNEVTVSVDALRQLLSLATPDSGVEGAIVEDKERGVQYRVALDMTKKSEPRLHSVEIVRTRVDPGLQGMTMKGGTLRPKGKVGSYMAPYDEAAFRVPVREVIAQVLAVLKWESEHRNDDGVRGIVVGARQLAPPTPQQLRQHLADGLTVQSIADLYGRKTRMVYGWLAAARKTTPKLDWPEVKHGPSPKTTDGK